MFLTQPPVTSSQINMEGRVYCGDDYGPHWDWGCTATPRITNPNGLTLADVTETARYQPGDIETIAFLDVMVFTPRVQELMDVRGRFGTEDEYV
jgi:hypothetical protein